MNFISIQEELNKICFKWQITELSVFGSVLREDFSDSSDIDFLVSFSDKARYGYFELVELQEELKTLIGRDVDLVSKSGIEKSKNTLRKNETLNSARVLYAA